MLVRVQVAYTEKVDFELFIFAILELKITKKYDKKALCLPLVLIDFLNSGNISSPKK